MYDFADLEATVASLRSVGSRDRFYLPDPAGARISSLYQGDVIEMRTGLPYLDQDGEVAGLDHESGFWLVVGNTCDFERSDAAVPVTQLAPVLDLGPAEEVEPDQLAALRAYKTSRTFLIPAWRGVADRVYIADFQHLVAASKSGLRDHAVLQARLTMEGWILLHASLVRFLCRDDGRHDAA